MKPLIALFAACVLGLFLVSIARVADDLPALKEKAEAGRLPFFYLTPVDGAGPQSHETTSPAIFH